MVPVVRKDFSETRIVGGTAHYEARLFREEKATMLVFYFPIIIWEAMLEACVAPSVEKVSTHEDDCA
jgi:hypothetical protein